MKTNTLLLIILWMYGAHTIAQNIPVSSGSDTTFDAYEVTKAPEPLNLSEVKRKIVYPNSMRASGVQGKVYVKILVSETGDYLRHEVRKSPHDSLSAACTAVLPHLKFSPGLLNNQPVKVWMMIPFDFRLTGGETEAPLLPPQPLNQAEVAADIKLSKKCRKRNVPCTLEVMALVDAEGKPLRFMSSGVSLDPCVYAEAEPHLHGLLFSPARKAGKATEGWAKIVFDIK